MGSVDCRKPCLRRRPIGDVDDAFFHRGSGSAAEPADAREARAVASAQR